MSSDWTTCVPCSKSSPGCKECLIDEKQEVICIDCIDNLKVKEGECVYPNCDEYVTMNHQGKRLEEAFCTWCSDGWGLQDDGHCYKCDNIGEYWDSCSDCIIDQNNRAWDCIHCSGDKSLIQTLDTSPKHTCGYFKH